MRIALLATVILLIDQKYYFGFAYSISSASKDVCLTPGCISAANRILELVDTAVNPCDDFYKYACGKLINNTILMVEDTSIGLVSNAQKKLNRQLYSILNGMIDPRGLSFEQLPRLLLQSCMNEAENEKVALKTLKKYINSFGGCPVIERHSNTRTTDKQTWNWMSLTTDFRHAGFDFDQIISISVAINSTNTSARIIEVRMSQ